MAGLRPAEPGSFTRDRVTWLAYLCISVYAFYIYALGPVVALLRSELHLSYTLASLHSTLWAVGSITTGLCFDRLTRWLGRRLLFWLAALVSSLGVLLFLFGHQVALTLPAAAVLSVGSTTLGAVSSVVLADRHGESKDRALLEANSGASATGVVVPALLGLLAGTAGGWRPGLLLPVLALGLLFVRFHALPLPAPRVATSQAARLPRSFWPACSLVALAVAIEFVILFYGAPLLVAGSGLPTARATAVLSAFVGGELVGRLAGGWLTRRPGRSEAVIGSALLVTMVAFLVLWLGRNAVLQGVALFVTGTGVGNLYPLSLAMALGAGGGLTDRAMARIQVAVALAIGAAPLLLGVLSDRAGLLRALALEPVLIVAMALVLFRMRPRGGIATVPVA